MKKANVPHAELRAGCGLLGDVHAGPGRRQVSLLSVDSIATMRRQVPDIAPGDFAENITTSGLDLPALRIGDRLAVGDSAQLEITQFGKACHGRCAIFERVGDCVMPREGVFAKVVVGGMIRVGDTLEVIHDQDGDIDGQR